MLKLIICSVIIALAVFCDGYQVTNNEIPSYIKICHKSDDNLNDCVRKSIEELRPFLTTGMPELGIPQCEPLIIPKIVLDQSAGAMNFKSEYSNITVTGPSKFELKSIRVDPVKNRFRLKLWFPELQMKSVYKIEGNLLMMPLQGTGMCYGNYSDVDAIAALRGERVIRNNQEFLKIKDFFIEFNIGNASVYLSDLFNGDPELGQVMNKFLNENWKTVAAEMRPALEDSISEILREVAKNIFEKYPLNLLLPE